MSLVTRSNNNRNVGYNARGGWTPGMAKALLNIAKTAAQSISKSSQRTSSSNGGEWVANTTAVGTGGTKRRGGKRVQRKSGIPRSIGLGKIALKLNGFAVLANTSAFNHKSFFLLQVPDSATPTAVNHLFNSTTIGNMDYRVISSFYNVCVKKLTLDLVPILSHTSTGYTGVGVRQEGLLSSNYVDLELVANCAVSEINPVMVPATVDYIPNKHKGVMRGYGDNTTPGIDGDERQVGVVIVYGSNSMPNIGDAFALLKVSAYVECWNDLIQ